MRTASPSIVPARSRVTKSPWWEPSRSLPRCRRCEAVRRDAGRVLDAHVPRAGEVRRRRGRRRRLDLRRLREDGEEPLGHDLLVAGAIMYGPMETPVSLPSVLPARGEERDARLAVEEQLRDRVAGRPELRLSQRIWRTACDSTARRPADRRS